MSDIKMNFDVEVAKKVGSDAAIILSNIRFWIATNKANKRHFYDGKYWMYNSAKAFTEHFEWLNDGQIKRCISKLISCNLIVVGNYNKSTYDRTNWYAIPANTTIDRKQPMEGNKTTNGIAQNDQPIPYNNTYNKPIEENVLFSKEDLHSESLIISSNNKKEGAPEKIDFDALLKYFNTVGNKGARLVTEKAQKQFNDRMKEGYTKADIKNVIDNAFKDEFHAPNFKHTTLEFISKPDKFERYASIKPVPAKKENDGNFYNQ